MSTDAAHLPPPGRLEVGSVAKPHGLRGEVVVALLDEGGRRLAPTSVLWAGDRELTVVSSQRHQRRWIVRFAGVETREAAEALHGRTLSVEAPRDEPGLWVHRLVGLDVVTTAGEACGVITAVQANPAHDLLVLDSGALVPVVFIVDEPDGARLVIDPPAGLLDL